MNSQVAVLTSRCPIIKAEARGGWHREVAHCAAIAVTYSDTNIICGLCDLRMHAKG